MEKPPQTASQLARQCVSERIILYNVRELNEGIMVR